MISENGTEIVSQDIRETNARYMAEQSVLAGCMAWPNKAHRLSRMVSPPDYQDHRHMVIASRIKAIIDDGGTPDAVTVMWALEKANELDRVGGSLYLMELSGQCLTAMTSTQHARYIREEARTQRIDQEGGRRPGESPSDYRDRLSRLIDEIGEDEESDFEDVPIARFLNQAIVEEQNEKIGLVSKLGDLHKLIPSFRPGQLVVIAGRPGHGKTTLMRKLARDFSDTENQSLFYSFEEPGADIAWKLLSEILGIESVKDADFNAIHQAESLRIQVDDDCPATIGAVTRRSRKRFHKRRYSAIFVDYLQLMSDDEAKGWDKRHLELAAITKQLKALARELSCTVFMGSQVTRPPKAGNPRPKLHSLRDSGGIEADADVVLAMYRAEVDRPSADWAKGFTEVLVLKQRRTGRLGFEVLGHTHHGFYDLGSRNQGYRRDAYIKSAWKGRG